MMIEKLEQVKNLMIWIYWGTITSDCWGKNLLTLIFK